MTSQLNLRILSFYRYNSKRASGIVSGAGFLVLVRWLFNIPAFKGVLPGLGTMRANTAVAFVLSGISLWLASTKRENQWLDLIAKGCATVTALIGLLTLSKYIFGKDIQQLGFYWLVLHEALPR